MGKQNYKENYVYQFKNYSKIELEYFPLLNHYEANLILHHLNLNNYY